MVDLVDSIGRKLERNYISSQGPCLQIAGAPQFVGCPSDCWGPLRLLGSSYCRGLFRLLRSSQIAWAPQIAGTPQTAERGPSRLLRAHQIAMGPQIAGASQIYGSPSKLLGPLRLLGVPQIAETLQISGSPSKLLEPLRLLGLLVIFLCIVAGIAGYFPMYSGSSGGYEILVSYIDLVFCNR